MNNTCTCGRIGEHCPNSRCGSINKWPLIQRTAFMASQIGADVRFYRCRKCGTEYGYLNGSLFDAECYAPKEARLVATPQSLEREVKDLNEAVQFVQRWGGVITFPDGLKDPTELPSQIIRPAQPVIEPKAPIQQAEPELIIKRVDSESESEEPPKTFTIDDLFKPKEPRDE